MLGALVLVAGGCQSYERRPLDLEGHRAAFLARTPEGPEVRGFAESLARGGDLASGFDVADGVSCEEAEVVALVFNAELRMARLRAGVAQASAANAGLWEDPTLGVDLVKIVESTPEPWKVFATVGLTLPISGRLEIEKQRAGAEHAAELAKVAELEWETRIEVRRAWTEWSALDAELGTTREFLARVEQVIGVVDKMEAAGEMARTEARLFRIERATRAAELGVLESRVREGELRLKRLMGLSPDAAVAWRSVGVGPASTGAEGADVVVTQQEVAARSPAMAVAVAEYEVAERALELEVRKQYPDLEIGPGYGREDGQDQVLFGLSLPLPVLNGNKQGIAEANARRDVARASAETTLEGLLASARAARVRLEAASGQRGVFEGEIVPLVDAQYADARRVAELGEINTLVLLESFTRQQEAKVKLIEARRDEALARIEVEAVVGPRAVK